MENATLTEQAGIELLKDWPLPSMEGVAELCDFEGPCITIYMPEHLPGAESKSSTMHLEMMLDEAAIVLRDRSVSEEDAEKLLAPLRMLEEVPGMHQGHREGLVLLRSPQTFRYFRLPQFHQNCLFIEEHFHVVPLIQHLFNRPDFYLMKLSRKGCSLLEIDMANFKPVEMPESVVCDYETFKSLDQPDHLLRARSGSQTGKGSMSPVSFGTSSDREKEMDHFHDFCRSIDRGLYPMLVAKAMPLVVAGTETELAAYKRANRFPLLLKEGVVGSPEGGASDAEMVDHARRLLRNWRTPEELRILKLYKDIEGSPKTLLELHAIVEAASRGRVENLLVADGVAEIGNYDAITNRKLLSGSFQATQVDLANAAVVDTLRHGGKVLRPEQETDSNSTAVAAILRY